MSRVVNVKVAHIRPQFKNLAEWCADPNHVYIGRPGVVFVDGQRYPSSAAACEFSNPFKITTEASRDDVVGKYRAYALQRMRSDADFRRKVFALRDKTLGCWCSPEACHGDVLVELSKMSEKDFMPAPEAVGAAAAENSNTKKEENVDSKRRQREDVC